MFLLQLDKYHMYFSYMYQYMNYLHNIILFYLL